MFTRRTFARFGLGSLAAALPADTTRPPVEELAEPHPAAALVADLRRLWPDLVFVGAMEDAAFDILARSMAACKAVDATRRDPA